LSIIESLPSYGVHYYKVKDKAGLPWWLGLNIKGISVYDDDDKQVPRLTFFWKNIENIFYREKKFCLEVHNPKRVSTSTRRQQQQQQQQQQTLDISPSDLDVHSWICPSTQLTKAIWNMAVSQHHFSIDISCMVGLLFVAWWFFFG
ncbi:hypothetical protein HELRODRAFT_77221, partial [Helobdella robusta]|uniref:FERM domain-containing protein n=1 Tax=Helobdella robusta TaxID=6412 RepID=T1G2U6_HELRO